MGIVWNDEKLEQLHGCLLEIILEVDRICEKNDITYFLGGGTLLGAVRNGDFLPWDEDADLMMKREDYDRFCAAAKKDLGSRFFLQDHENDPHSHRPYIRVRLNGTVMETAFSAHFPKLHQGIFVDIFCHDKTAKTAIGQKLHVIETIAVNSLVYRKWESMAVPKIKKGWKNLISAPFPMSSLEGLQDKLYRRYSGKTANTYLYDGMGKHLKRGAFPEKWLDGAERKMLGGHPLPVPKGYDAYLKWLYGDYMKIPQKSEQKPASDIVRLEFGIDAKENGGRK